MRQVLAVGEFEFLDALYQRYADPMPLLEQMAASGRLSWFVEKFVNKCREDENEETLWDMWLHKVWNQDFEDFKRGIKNKARTIVKNEYIRTHPKETAKTVEKSRAIIEMFSKPTD